MSGPRLTSLCIAGAALALLASCGGSSSTPSAPTASPTPTPAPAPTPTPTPAPTGTPDPRTGLPEGPVVRFTIKIRSVDTGNFKYRDPEQNEKGHWILYPGEFVVFDSTQKNAGDQVCKWVNDPVWNIKDPTSVLALRGSSNPFLLRADVDHRNPDPDEPLVLQAVIDGVESNVIEIVAIKKQ